MPTSTKEARLLDLDMKVKGRLIALSKKHPHMCAEYLEKMHKIIDWAEKELKEIK